MNYVTWRWRRWVDLVNDAKGGVPYVSVEHSRLRVSNLALHKLYLLIDIF